MNWSPRDGPADAQAQLAQLQQAQLHTQIASRLRFSQHHHLQRTLACSALHELKLQSCLQALFHLSFFKRSSLHQHFKSFAELPWIATKHVCISQLLPKPHSVVSHRMVQVGRLCTEQGLAPSLRSPAHSR